MPALATPLDSPIVLHADDTRSPRSKVLLPVRVFDASVEVAWSGSDAASGVEGFMSLSLGMAGPYDRWLADTDSNSAMFEGNPGSTDFYSRAPTALRTLSRRPRRPTQTRLSTDHLGSQRHHDDVGRHVRIFERAVE
jgi:hypothetical protein